MMIRKRILPALPSTHFEVLIDSNEGHRIPFGPSMWWWPSEYKYSSPTLLTIASRGTNLGRLDYSYGDITLEGYAHRSGIERKGKMSELYHDWKTGKLERQFQVLATNVQFPYLLLDIPLTETYGTGSNSGYRPDDPTPTILDKIIPLAKKHGLGIIGPVTAKSKSARQALGEYLLRILLSHVKGAEYVPFNILRRPKPSSIVKGSDFRYRNT